MRRFAALIVLLVSLSATANGAPERAPGDGLGGGVARSIVGALESDEAAPDETSLQDVGAADVVVGKRNTGSGRYVLAAEW